MENYLGKDIGKLGFGLMRLPEKDGKIDIEQVKTMVDMFMEKGFTYFDTAYVYGGGASELAAKEATVKNMLSGEQQRVAFADLSSVLH